MKEHAFRLTNGQDLRLEIEKYTVDHNIKAGIILCCVGSLSKVILRTANGKDVIELKNNYEIVSITGTFSYNDSHIHISVSDDELNVYGGHLKKGSIVNTTAEIVILELANYIFDREMDNTTGYVELAIKNINNSQTL